MGNAELADYQNRLKEALLALKKMRTRLETMEKSSREPIAVIGIGCRYPGGVTSPETFWQLMRQAVDAIQEVPPDRWDIDAYYDPNRTMPGKMYTRYGGFIENPGHFDPHFFGISPREARSMDPQQRLLLEVAWEALEDAGYSPEGLTESQTGVFVGVTMSDYLQLQSNINSPEQIGAYRITGNMFNSIPGRVSYLLGLHGPAVAVDTACSSSLVAIYLAVQSLLTGDSSMALAGGVNLLLSPEVSISACQSNMLATDGRCKTFDSRADGFIRSDGCGIVVLKRLSDAVTDHDRILAIIRGAAVNHDGFSSGFTVPSKLAQEAVIRTALKKAEVSPDQVGYVEAHGTGTPLGDPIEVRALGAVYGAGRSNKSPLQVGSIKTNFGHTEAAAGVAGLIKVVLSLYHGEIPAHLHLKELNPNITWNNLPIKIPTRLTKWEPINGRRLAGVSSFGASGVNAHLILEETSKDVYTGAGSHYPAQIMCLSAKTSEALRDLAESFDRHLVVQPEIDLGDICFTANYGRSHFNHRLAVYGDFVEKIRNELAAFAAGDPGSNLVSAELEKQEMPRVAFMFTGHGSQYSKMGYMLYQTAPIFRQAFDEVKELLQAYLDEPIAAVMYPDSIEDSPLFLEGMKYTQPALFALEYSLAKLWLSWGIKPEVVVGHSVGEYAAACIAGILSLPDAVKLVAARGRLMDELPEAGSMAVVFADEGRVAAALEPYLDQLAIAVINNRENIVISGSKESVHTVIRSLSQVGIRSRILDIAQASHSPLVEPILDEFEQIASEVSYAYPKIDYISCLTGDLVKAGEASQVSYWRQHMRQTVRFADAVQRLHNLGLTHFIEIGPSPTLLGIAKRVLPEGFGTWLPSIRKDRNDWDQILNSLAILYTHGATIDWDQFYLNSPRRKVSLPTYPFQRQRYWVEAGPKLVSNQRSGEFLHPLLGQQLRVASQEKIFETRLSLNNQTFLADHLVQGGIILPATAFIEILIAAGHVLLGKTITIEAATFQETLPMQPEVEKVVQILAKPEKDKSLIVQIVSLDETSGDWKLHMNASIRQAAAVSADIGENLTSLQSRCSVSYPLTQFYKTMQDRGLDFGPTFHNLEQIWLGEGEVLAKIRPNELLSLGEFYIHPALLDACLQPIGTLLPEDGQTYLPFHLDELRLYADPGQIFWSHISIQASTTTNQGAIGADIHLYAETGELLAQIKGLTFVRPQTSDLQSQLLKNWLYEVAWQPAHFLTAKQKPAPGNWLIFADGKGMGGSIQKYLEKTKCHCTVVRPGSSYLVKGPDNYILNPTNPEDFLSLLDSTGETEYQGVLYLWALDVPDVIGDNTNPGKYQEIFCAGALHLAQALALRGIGLPQGLTLVTRKAFRFAAEEDGNPNNPTTATLWGLGKVIAQEHPEFNCVCLDLDISKDEFASEKLLETLAVRGDENQIALYNGQYYVPRMVRSSILEGIESPARRKNERYELNFKRKRHFRKIGVYYTLTAFPRSWRSGN